MHQEVENSATAIGHLPSGLNIVCAKGNNGLVDGFLASWVQQVSFNPAMISLAIKPGRPAYDLINEGAIFSVNIVGEHEKGYLRHFWKGYDANDNPFEGKVSHEITSDGGVILNEAKSVMVCQLTESVSPGDHQIVFAKVLKSYILDEKAKPSVHIRKSGLDY